MRVLVLALLAACAGDADGIPRDAPSNWVEDPSPCRWGSICDPHCGYLFTDAISCPVKCPDTPATDWCAMIGAYDSCCRCDFTASDGWHWDDVPLDCAPGDGGADAAGDAQ